MEAFRVGLSVASIIAILAIFATMLIVSGRFVLLA